MDICCVSGPGPGQWALWQMSQRSLCSDSVMGKPDIQREGVHLEQTPRVSHSVEDKQGVQSTKPVLGWVVSQGSYSESGHKEGLSVRAI